MRSPREVKRHIRTVREISHLTRAMKLVAAAKLKDAQARVEAARPFARKISEVLLDISSFAGYVHPLMAGREMRKVGIMVVTSDRGLCGRYNDDIIEA
ncbi:MAG: F0F1 ATP synthase subunit gamma, partial [Bacillota bacterium]